MSAKDFPDWLTYFSLVDLSHGDPLVRDELADLQNDASAATVHKVKCQLMCLNDEIQEKYPKLAYKAVKLLLLFPSTYLVECDFSTVTDILTKKRCSLNIAGHEDLHLRLTEMILDIPAITKQH